MLRQCCRFSWFWLLLRHALGLRRAFLFFLLLRHALGSDRSAACVFFLFKRDFFISKRCLLNEEAHATKKGLLHRVFFLHCVFF